jgi:hypothetical protein
MTPSRTKPYWACPEASCEAIIDPPPVRVSGRYALRAGGPLLEGSGELGGFDPQDLQSAYKMPTSGGENQTIAIVDAFGYKAAESDLAKYRERYGLEPCTAANGCLRKVNEKGEEANYPPPPEPGEGWEVESALDLDMASAACPHCHVLLVEAAGPQAAHLGAAVNTAARLGATEISNSYGAPEANLCSEANCEEFSADWNHPGVLVTAAAGDNGYNNYLSGNASPNFPAALPDVVAVGGTSLKRTPSSRGWSEEVWSGGGSGCSESEPRPSWQTDKGCAGRTESDVAAVASCETPVSIYNAALEGWRNVCGTSVSAPLVAGIEAHASEYARSLPGAAAFYSDPGALFDVTKGSNGECAPPPEHEYLCHAEVGYDGPTGNGTPDGPLQLASGPPSVATQAATAVTGAAGTLNGTVNPNGFATTYRFEFGTSTSYGTSVPVPDAPAGSGKLIEQVHQVITGLQPDTTYHYRLVATNSQGASEGEDSSFATAQPTVTGVQPGTGPSDGGSSVTITGTNFLGATAVEFGAANAKSFKVDSETSITAVSPAGTGTVDVTVTTPAGTSATGAADQYFYTLGPKLSPSDESGRGLFGFRVALSADGNTALVSGRRDGGGNGAAWIFTRSGATWTQQGAKLTPNDKSGAGEFGSSVALSSDGNTALVGGIGDGAGKGAAWVFTRSGTTWTQQGAKLTPSDASGRGLFGWSVALSSHGDTALVGGPGDSENKGAAWIFTRSGATWTQQGAKLTPSDESGAGGFGWSVALSSHGDTALVGGPFDSPVPPPCHPCSSGAAWVFTRSGTTWSQQGAQLTPSDASSPSLFGQSVALSSHGDTALVGGPGDNGVPCGKLRICSRGAAWIFTRSGATWTQQAAKLTPNDESGFGFSGASVALSSHGDTALVSGTGDSGGKGAAWIFTRSGATWTQRGAKLTPSDESGGFGVSVALSSDGVTSVVGEPTNAHEVGAAWAFVSPPPPTVSKVEPNSGPSAGGTSVSITGTNFTETSTVNFGAAEATEVQIKSASEITVLSPPGAGTVDVTVTTRGTTSRPSSADRFNYGPNVTKVEPNSGPAAGGTSVTIIGTNFSGAKEVKFGGTTATSFKVESATSITAVSPAGKGSVAVTVTTPGGTSATSSQDRFAYSG